MLHSFLVILWHHKQIVHICPEPLIYFSRVTLMLKCEQIERIGFCETWLCFTFSLLIYKVLCFTFLLSITISNPWMIAKFHWLIQIVLKGTPQSIFHRVCKTSLMNWPPVNCSSVFSKKAYFFPFWKLLEQSLMDGSLCSIGKHWNIVFLLNKAGKSYLAPKVHKFVNNHFYSLFNINMLQ